jgi:hypothetical protein
MIPYRSRVPPGNAVNRARPVVLQPKDFGDVAKLYRSVHWPSARGTICPVALFNVRTKRMKRPCS